MKDYFAYIRVSSAKQGEGVSLQEQRDAIKRYAKLEDLSIARWFEERETAAKRGRLLFGRMMRRLRKGKARGVIIHKIDRSARNLRDWADLGELLDRGVDVRFAKESLDLSSRGGRLSADIQAVVAADFIRNLREETRKGIYGRLKQGLYPRPAPLGYRDNGSGKPKTLDPVKGPLVKQAFELYATGCYAIKDLVEKMHTLGLRNRRSGRVSINAWSILLKNPFYIGLIRLQKSGETFEGIHAPLIPKSLFDRVQLIISGRAPKKASVHDHLLRLRLNCAACGYHLVGERQKGRVYYRCHTKGCSSSIREDRANRAILNAFQPLKLSEKEMAYASQRIRQLRKTEEREAENACEGIKLAQAKLSERLGRLTDAYLEGVVDRQLFAERKKALLMERKALEERLEIRENVSALDQASGFLELAKSAYLTYELGQVEEKRDLLENLTSNRTWDGQNLTVALKKPFDLIAERPRSSSGTPSRGTVRTLLAKLIAFAHDINNRT